MPDESGELFCSIVFLCTRWLGTSNAYTYKQKEEEEVRKKEKEKENWVCCFQWKDEI